MTNDAGSPPEDSKRPDEGPERQEGDEIGSKELRGVLGERSRGGKRRPDIEQYVVESKGQRGRAEGVGR